MIHEIATCCSYISNDYLLMCLAVLFYIFSKKAEHAHLVILLLFAMVYKACLKELLKIPAPVTSPTKYGFPSGHINFATMFFGWFIVTYKSKLLYWLCPMAFALASWSTIYLGYHDILDVLLTPLLPICALIIHTLYLRQASLNKLILVFIITSLICQIISFFALEKMPIDVIIGSYGILGFGIATLMLSNRLKMLMLFIAIALLFLALSNDMLQFSQNCIWLLVFGSLPSLSKIRALIRKKFSF